MKNRLARASLVASLLCSIAVAASADFKPVKLDTTHSRIGFTASTLLFDVDGEFESYKVLLEGDPDKPETAKVQVEIDATSIDTGNDKRDEHLRGEDFFAASKHGTINFVSTAIKKTAKGIQVSGKLTMHGVTKTVTIPFKVARGKNGAGVESVAYKGKLVIDRSAFGIGADSVAAKISLDDEVELDLLLVTLR